MRSLLPSYLKILVCLLLAGRGYAQDTSVKDTSAIQIFSKVEVESAFPGGAQGWARFLQTHLVYPPKAARKNIEGEVVLQFIVGKDGKVSDVSALSGPPLLQQAALEVMSQSPKWTPATQDGKKVKSYKKQPIVFRLK